MVTIDLGQILTYIDTHIYEKITLGELAELAGYSPFYFSKLFSEAMGMPVTGYIRIRKLQHAITSLLEGKKVLDVSLMYAFDSHEGFTRAFTQLFGSTPSTVKKYMTSYRVPEYVVPVTNFRRKKMETNYTDKLQENLHQLIYEVLTESIKEAKEGYCTEIEVTIADDGTIKITDNGRGIPLTQNKHADQVILDKILAGHPITNAEYSQMGDFSGIGMQTVNSLCESLQVCVYRDGMCFKQDYVRGIPQHEVLSESTEHPSGTEITLKPDTAIFGSTTPSDTEVRSWLKERIEDIGHLKVHVERQTADTLQLCEKAKQPVSLQENN